MAPLGLMSPDRKTGGQRSNQTGVRGEGGNGDLLCNSGDNLAPPLVLCRRWPDPLDDAIPMIVPGEGQIVSGLEIHPKPGRCA